MKANIKKYNLISILFPLWMAAGCSPNGISSSNSMNGMTKKMKINKRALKWEKKGRDRKRKGEKEKNVNWIRNFVMNSNFISSRKKNIKKLDMTDYCWSIFLSSSILLRFSFFLLDEIQFSSSLSSPRKQFERKKTLSAFALNL